MSMTDMESLKKLNQPNMEILVGLGWTDQEITDFYRARYDTRSVTGAIRRCRVRLELKIERLQKKTEGDERPGFDPKTDWNLRSWKRTDDGVRT